MCLVGECLAGVRLWVKSDVPGVQKQGVKNEKKRRHNSRHYMFNYFTENWQEVAVQNEERYDI